ncbi:MAG: hypothetical protein KGI97_00835 [Alphaproteobacteria bacterium]|nr:hypothetical protein [Alphaproteobacteria bacterium]
MSTENNNENREALRIFLEQWETDTRPVHEMLLKSWDNGHAFAKLTIQTMFFLNGGALIAFPTFAKLANVVFAEHLHLSLASIFSFIIGLICIAVTSLLAYFTCANQSNMLVWIQEVRKLDLHCARDPQEKTGQWKTKKDEAMENVKKEEKKLKRILWITIIIGLFSLFAFITGSCLAAYILATAGHAPITSAI